ncbi:terminase small subunit [bacterium]|nr:terminase small subunit [bacterium]
MSHRSKEDKKFGLNNQQVRFLDFYRSDPELNQTKAYRRAYPGAKDDRVAQAASSRLLSKVIAREYLESRAAEEHIEGGVAPTINRIIQELKASAFFDPYDLFGENNRLKEIHELPDHVRRAIGSIKTTKRVEKTGGEDITTYYITEVKLISKEKTLELLGRHLVMFTDRFQIETEEAMHERVRAEILAKSEETLSRVMANIRRVKSMPIAAEAVAPAESSEKSIDSISAEALGRLL